CRLGVRDVCLEFHRMRASSRDRVDVRVRRAEAPVVRLRHLPDHEDLGGPAYRPTTQLERVVILAHRSTHWPAARPTILLAVATSVLNNKSPSPSGSPGSSVVAEGGTGVTSPLWRTAYTTWSARSRARSSRGSWPARRRKRSFHSTMPTCGRKAASVRVMPP